MFGRRVFCSAPLPRHMWARMHVQSQAQAMRMLPSLVPLAAVEGTRVSYRSGLAFNSLIRSSAGVGGEEGLVSQDGKLVGADVAAACAEWCAEALRVSCIPFHITFCAPSSCMSSLCTIKMNCKACG